MRRLLVVAALAALVAACGGGPAYVGRHRAIPHPVYKVGAPYQINGVWYRPHVDYSYDQVGEASWYGEAFDGRLTANGEVFDLNRLTAAHRTLPMPSIVELVNLQNGRALRLRVNDRGPFARGRIIDVSRRAAQLLGFERTGITRVRVRVLRQESIRAAMELLRGNRNYSEQGGAPALAATPPQPAAPQLATRSAPSS